LSGRIVDLTRILSSSTPVYPGDPAFIAEDAVLHQPTGFNLKRIATGLHVGTHVDAPRHYYADGSGVEAIPLAACVGRAVRIAVEPREGIVRTADVVSAWKRLSERAPRLLVHTGFGPAFGSPAFFTEYPGFEPSLFDFLKENGIVLLGLDLPSVKYGMDDGASAHADLLGAGIVVLETLAGTDLLPDVFFLSAAPIPYAGADGSPVRAYAVLD
jgi:arylformamidase